MDAFGVTGVAEISPLTCDCAAELVPPFGP